MLVTQTLDAVIASQLQQEERISRLAEAAALSPEEFRARHVDPSEVESRLAELFADTEHAQEPRIAEGKPYVPAGVNRVEEPAIRQGTGYEMQDTDFRKAEGGFVFTAAGCSGIREAVGMRIAAIRQEGYKAILARGVPRVLVDHGKVSARMTMHLQNTATGPNSLPGRLLVRPVNASGAEFLTMKTDITSEMEITFKTVVL